MAETPSPRPTPPGVAEIAVVRSIYDALAARDLDRLATLLDPEVVITQDPALEALRSPAAG